jgi:hypothetical protein
MYCWFRGVWPTLYLNIEVLNTATRAVSASLLEHDPNNFLRQ